MNFRTFFVGYNLVFPPLKSEFETMIVPPLRPRGSGVQSITKGCESLGYTGAAMDKQIGGMSHDPVYIRSNIDIDRRGKPRFKVFEYSCIDANLM